MLIIRGMLGGLFQLTIIAALLIVPAGLAVGEWGWLRGWQLIGCYGAAMFASTIAMAIWAPDSLEARLRPPSSSTQPFEDKVATFFLISSIVFR